MPDSFVFLRFWRSAGELVELWLSAMSLADSFRAAVLSAG